MDERHFDYYDKQNRLPNQITLLQNLEQRGFETKGKYILTTDSIGIPVTSILLLLKESLEHIEGEQTELSKNEKNKLISSLSLDELQNEISITPKTQERSPSLQQDWKKYRVWDIANSPAISGSVVAYQSPLYAPEDQSGRNLQNDYETTDDNIHIYKTAIHSTKERMEQKSLIQLCKRVILFSELSYALQQRVNVERRDFERHLDVKVQTTQAGNAFNSICARRAGIIHGGSFKLSIDPKTSKIMFGKKRVALLDAFDKSYEEAIVWVHNTYGRMLEAI